MQKANGLVWVTGIDTDVGKTVATGFLARRLGAMGAAVITQKWVQTGVDSVSAVASDIVVHRRLMGLDLQAVDLDFTTCPYRFKKACSPHLAARLEGGRIDPAVLQLATARLQVDYDWVLMEGAGGLLVPLNEDLTLLDYVASQGYAVALVTSGRLGSLNHTLLSLEALASRGLSLCYLLYNPIADGDAQIVAETRCYLKAYLDCHFASYEWIDLPILEDLLMG